MPLPATPSHSLYAHPLHSRTVVIVDDDDDMRLLLRLVLERSHYRVVGEEPDGPDAIKALTSLAAPPTALVLDHLMPLMTGLDLAEAILAEHPGLPIVLLSAHLDEELSDRAHALGIAACLRKTSCTSLPEVLDRVISAASC